MSTMPWIKEMFETKGVAYSEVHHPRATTAQDVAKKEHFSGRRVAKVVVVIADGRPLQLVLPAHLRIDLGLLSDALDTADIRLASESELSGIFKDCALGAEPPLRHWSGVDIWMDESMRGSGDILFQAGTHEDGIRMRFEDWFTLVQPKTASFAA